MASSMLQNIFSLYGVQMINLVLPLLLTPFLARVLQPSAWGQFLAIQSLAMIFATIIEFGFMYSATRDVSQKTKPHADIVAGVQGAKLLLIVVILVLAVLVYVFVPSLSENHALYIWGVTFAVLQGMNPYWYFLGIEKMPMVSMIEVVSKMVYTLSVFVSIHRPENVHYIFMLQSIFALLALLVSTYFMYKNSGFVFFSIQKSIYTLKQGLTMFTFRVATTLYTTATSMLLRFYVPSHEVAFYGGAERITNVGKAVTSPIGQVVFSRMNHLSQGDFLETQNMFFKSLKMITLISLVIGAGMFFGAEIIVGVLLGQAYMESARVLQYLAVTIPLVGMSQVMGVQWMVVYRMDRAFNTILVAGGLVGVLMMLVLVPEYRVYGMVFSVVVVEIFVTLSMFLYLWQHSKSPFRRVK